MPQKEPLPTNFPCLFCNHEKSVSVKIDKKAGVGELSCKVCGQQFQTNVNCMFPSAACFITDRDQDLSASVDVYSDWIDACDSVARDNNHNGGEIDDGLNSYADLTTGSARRNSEMNVDRRLVAAVGGGEYDDDIVDDVS